MNPDRQAFDKHGHRSRHLRTRLWQFAAVALLMVAAYVVLGRQLMPLVPEWRQPLSSWLEQQLGTELEIGALSGRMDGLSPVLELETVRLPVADGESPLVLDQVALTLDVLPSLVERRPRLRRLLVRGAELELARTPDGELSFRGLKTGREPPSLEQMLAWVYRQNRVVLDEVRLTLDWPGAPRLRTRDLELALANSGRHHRVSLRADSMDGERQLDLRLALDRDAYQWSDLHGRVYTRLQGSGWQRWLRDAELAPVAVEQVDGDLSVWTELAGGQLRSATLKVALDHLRLRDERNDSAWWLSGGSTLARLDNRDPGYHLSLRQMELTSAQGNWRASHLGVFWNAQPEDELTWRFLARGFDLATTREQIRGLPFQRSQRLEQLSRRLQQFAPAGRVEKLHAAGNDSGVNAFSGHLGNFESRAREGVPGLSGLSGWFAGTPERGVARVDSDALRLALPGLYEHPLRARARGALRWQRGDQGLVLESGRIQLRNQDASADTMMALHFRDETPAELRLVGDLREGRATAAARYVPGGNVDAKLKQWLEQAFEEGRVTRGRFLYQGPVRIDPRRQQDRTLQMGFRVRGLRLHYLDGWPAMTDLDGQVQLDGRRVEGRDLSGRLRDTRVQDLGFVVPGTPPGKAPELTLSGRLQGPSGDLSHILHNTPLGERLPAALQDWRLSGGELDARLALRWPLGGQAREPRVLSQGRLADANLVSDQLDLRVDALTGDFSYDLRGGLNMDAVTGRLFGSPMEGRVHSDGEASRLTLTGEAPMQRIRSWADQPWLDDARGRVPYEAALRVPRDGRGVSLSLESPLTGLALDLPAPLGKPASQEVPLSVHWSRTQPADELRFRYGRRLAGLLLADGGAWTRGHLALGGGEPEKPAQPGVRIDGRVTELEIQPWVDWVRDRTSSGPGSPLPLDELVLNVETLDVYGLPVHDSELRLRPDGQGWRARLDSPDLAGRVHVPPNYRADGDRPLELTVDRADLDTAGDAGELEPADLPVADVELDDVTVNDTDFGRWRFAVRPVAEGVVLQDLDGRWRKTDFNGRLRWTGTANEQRSHFVGRLTAGRLQNALTAWGLDPVIESKQARSVVDLRWPGSPLDADYQGMTGHASVAIGECRIPETSRGASALRVLGILNVGSLSRRLRLDFSDLYKKGLSCDGISGDFELDNAIINTDNLVIESPSAEFRIRGKLNLDNKTLDHHMDVTLPLSSNLYAGCLAGPAACAGIFVFDRLWGSELEKMTTLSYRVTGSWADPKVRELGDTE